MIEEDDFDELLSEDDWEDEMAYQELLNKMPNGWYMVKVENYNTKKLTDIDEWCKDNCVGKYERVGWRTGCAYTVGVQFAEPKDAVYFKLMWS